MADYNLNMSEPPRTPNRKLQAQYRQMMRNYVSPPRNTHVAGLTPAPRGAGSLAATAYSPGNNINMSAQVPNSSVKKLEESRKQLNEAIAKGKAEANARRAQANTKRATHQTTLNRFGFSRNGKKGGTRRLRRTRKH